MFVFLFSLGVLIESMNIHFGVVLGWHNSDPFRSVTIILQRQISSKERAHRCSPPSVGSGIFRRMHTWLFTSTKYEAVNEIAFDSEE